MECRSTGVLGKARFRETDGTPLLPVSEMRNRMLLAGQRLAGQIGALALVLPEMFRRPLLAPELRALPFSQPAAVL
jgi:hypothetical protein